MNNPKKTLRRPPSSKWINKKCKVDEFKVTNIVANADIGWKIDIAEFSGDSLAFKD